MNERACDSYDEVLHVRQRLKILKATLLAVYVAGKENVYDMTTYVEAIQGCVERADEALEGLDGLLELWKDENVVDEHDG